MSKLTSNQVQQIVELRESGWSYRRLAATYGVSAGAVYYHCLKLGACSPNCRGKLDVSAQPVIAFDNGRTLRRFTPEEDRNLQKLSLEGKTIQQISRHTGRAATSVRMRLMALAFHEEFGGVGAA